MHRRCPKKRKQHKVSKDRGKKKRRVANRQAEDPEYEDDFTDDEEDVVVSKYQDEIYQNTGDAGIYENQAF